MIEKRYVVRDCPFCDGGRDLLPSAGVGAVQGECGRCDGSGTSRAFLYPKPKGWRGPWPPPVPSKRRVPFRRVLEHAASDGAYGSPAGS